MTRREVLQGVALLLGGALSSSVAAAILGCGPRPGRRAGFRPRTLTPEQNELVAAIAERILPATDTPGSREAGVNEFIDLLLSDWLDAAERERFLAGLAELDSASQARHGRGFLGLTADQQLAQLVPLAAEAAEAVEARRTAEPSGLSEGEDPPFFLTMKEMTLAGYYTSEVGMTQELQHLRVAGSYSGCLPLAEVGRSWA